MTLMRALGAAVSGLRTTQAGIDLVSTNVANANSIGYTRRVMAPIQELSGDRTSGVRTGEIERALDTMVQRQLRLETSGAAYTALNARYAGELDRLFGQPGGAGSLDTAVNEFTQKLQALAADPGSYSVRSAALEGGRVLAGRIASIAAGVQALRTDAEGRIAAAVTRANELLAGIAELDNRVLASPLSPTAPGILDERDRLITELAQLMDVRVLESPNRAITLVTTGGMTLYAGGDPVRLTFDGRASLGANALYTADEGSRGVGTIRAISSGGIVTDVIAGGLIRSGEIAAALEQRDRILVEAQRQLDELAAGIARAFSDRQVSGTAAVNGAQTGVQVDFTGWQPGNTITLDYRDNIANAPRRIILVSTTGGAPAPIPASDTADPNAVVIRVDVSGGFGAAAAAIQAELNARGINLTVDSPAANTFRILDDGATGTTDVTAASAAITVTGLTSGRPELPFFVDSGYGSTPFTGSFEGVSHLTGFAQRMAVNPALLADRSLLVVFNAAPPTPQGDATRPQFLVDALTRSSRAFSAASGIAGLGGPYVSTVTDFARRVVETQGAQAEAMQRLDEGQSVALAAIESRYAERSGVNIDQEMAHLVQLQTAYGANARVITAVRDMLDMLLRI